MTDSNTPGQLTSTPLSVLDPVTIIDGKTPLDTFHNSLDLARPVEALG